MGGVEMDADEGKRVVTSDGGGEGVLVDSWSPEK